MEQVNLICDVFTVSILLILFTYHLVVFWGRKGVYSVKSDRSFALFALFLSCYLLTSRTLVQFNLIIFVAPVEAVFASLTFFFVARYFYQMLDNPLQKKHLLYFDSLLVLGILLSLSIFHLGIRRYMHTVFTYVVLVYMVALILLIGAFVWLIIKKNLYSTRHVRTMFIGVCLLLFYLVIMKLLLSFDGSRIPLAKNHLFAGIISILFSLALAQKSNKEFILLQSLKETQKNGASLNHDELFKFSEFAITAREQEIVLLVAKGFEYKEIANRLFISDRTVIRHMQNVFGKVGAHNKLEMLHKLSEL